MNERDLNEIKDILGIDDLRLDIKELRQEVMKLDHKLSGFWYKVVFTLIGILAISLIGGRFL